MTATGCPLCDCPEPCGCYAEGYDAGRALRAGGGLGPGGPRQSALKRRPFPGKCRSSSWCLWGKRPPPGRKPGPAVASPCEDHGAGEPGPPAGDAGRVAPALWWGDVEVHEAGSGRLHVARSKNQASEEAALYLGPAAVEALLAIRPQEAVIDPGASVFGLPVGQISRRIKAATKMAGLGDGFSAHSPRAADGVLSPVVQTWRPRFGQPVF